MRALVKAEKAEGLEMRDEPVPQIGPDDILIKVAKTGICVNCVTPAAVRTAIR